MKQKKKIRLPKLEFTKVILFVMTVFGIRWVEMSYSLAFQGLESNSEVTVTVVSVLLGTIYSVYMAKSFGEKNSRNKYKIKLKGDDDNEEKGDMS